MRRVSWVGVTVGGAVAALVGGRWLVHHTADRLWAASLGAAVPHADLATLRLALDAASVLVATVWYTGNLLLVYRQIGAVQLPRRVGDLEIVEHVPRGYLLAGVIVVGAVLGVVTSYRTADWWQLRALAGLNGATSGTEPVLGLSIGYYVFRLPWLRAMQGYALLLALIGLALLSLLYAAIGAIRRQEQRLVFVPFARWHVATLLGTVAVVLAWGYLLEPAELVGGLHHVPFDRILIDVRLPVARTLAVFALVAAAASAVWLRVDRLAVPVAGWAVLLGGSLFGHLVLPSLVAAARGPEGRAAPDLAAAAVEARARAFRLTAESIAVPLAVPDRGFAGRHHAELGALPVWDAFVLTEVLNRTARAMPPSPRSGDRFFESTLLAVPSRGGGPVPVFLAVREPDSLALESLRSAPWAARHGEPYAYAVGAVAVHGRQTADGGLPRYIPDLEQPDSTTARPTDVTLASREVWFGPGMPDFAIVAPDRGPRGILLEGWWRRVALAWTLQSPALLSRRRAPPGSIAVVDRAVPTRLARYAPMARFGSAYPVVADGRLVWVSTGYVAAQAFPLSTAVVWRGQQVRYLRAGFVGLVDARTGVTAVYLSPDADMLSQAWAKMLPGLIRPADDLPPSVRRQLRYPEELFRVQVHLLRDRPGRARSAEPQWRVGTAAGDPNVRLRLQAVDEVQLDARVAAVMEGTMREGRPRLRVLRYPEPYALSGPSELEQAFRDAAPSGAGIGGIIRLVPFEDGAVSVQSFYADSGTLAGVVAGWRGVAGRGRDAAEALNHLQPLGEGAATSVVGSPIEAARAWFRRLDQARADGDWRAFGEAWAGLRAALGLEREIPTRRAPAVR